jgi:hypothetical protein
MSLARMLRWLGGFGATSAAVLAFSPAAYGQWFGLGCSKCEKCPPPFVHHSEGPPNLKFKKACPKPVCDPCTLPHYGYFQTCWRPWLLPPDWSHCPVPPPGALVPQPPPPPYPPPPGRWIEPTPAPVPTLPKPRTTESDTQAQRAIKSMTLPPASTTLPPASTTIPPASTTLPPATDAAPRKPLGVSSIYRGQPASPYRTYLEPPLNRP